MNFNTKFLVGIFLDDENPYNTEEPEEVTFYDLDGREVSVNENE